MHRLFPILALVAVCLLAACTTPGSLMGAPPLDSQRGGDAEGSVGGFDALVALAQPGGEVRQVPVRNEDRVQTSQAAPSFDLNLVASPADAAAADLIVQSLATELAALEARRENLTAEGFARVDGLRTQLAERLDKVVSEARAAAAANLPQLQNINYMPVVIMSAGEAAQKLDPETARAASRGLLAAVLPGLDLDEETAKALGPILNPPPAPEDG